MNAHARRTARALVAAAIAVTIAGAGPPPAAAVDVEDLRERAQRFAEEVSGLEHRLADLQARRDDLGAQIGAADRSIAALELRRHDAETAHGRALGDYIGRAVDVYKSASPGVNLELILSARSFTELATLTRATSSSAVAARASLSELLEARSTAESVQADVDHEKQRLLADLELVEALESDIGATLAARRAAYGELNAEIARLEQRARREAAAAARAQPGATLQPAAALAALLSPAGPVRGIPSDFASTGVSFEGIASWYGPGFEGNSTANGDIFDPDEFTAASKELPLGSWLYVAHGGKGVVVYVNDRGPYIEGRVLDLSQAAAEAVGITGVGWVRATVLVKL